MLANAKKRSLTYQLSAVEVQSGEKVICLLSGKQKEVTEDRNSFFHVHIEDYYQMNSV